MQRKGTCIDGASRPANRLFWSAVRGIISLESSCAVDPALAALHYPESGKQQETGLCK